VHLPLGRTRPATKKELAGFLDFLEGELSERGFFPTAAMRPKMARNIRVMFERIPLTRQDLQTLFGIVKTMTHPRPRGSETRRDEDSNSV
jgi:tRNA/rRNA methyltransferase